MSYKRILLKLSGEVLAGEREYGICPKVTQGFAQEISEVASQGTEVGVVIGAGNIHRGVDGIDGGVERSASDHMGMLATAINAIALQDAFESAGVDTRVMTALEINRIAEPYIRRRAIRHLEKKRLVIFACGTGNPYFTTDTAAALRANEIDAEILLKATKVDGVYDKDPTKHEDAIRFEKLSYIDALNKEVGVMDATALTLCMENNLDLMVFDVFRKGNIKKVVEGENIGTMITRRG